MATMRRAALAAVRKAKLVTNTLSNSWSRSSIIGGNYQSWRWYILPPQLNHTAADYLDKAGISLAADWATPGIYPVHDAEVNTLAISSAKFAIEAQNKASAFQGNLRLMRVLRASSSHSVSGGGHKYYVTFEALRGKADVDVYYAEVVHPKAEAVNSKGSGTQLELIRCQLVDDSFAYPRYALGDFTKLHVSQSAIHEMLNSEGCLTEELEMDIPPANAIFDINTFENVCKYALFAVTTHNKNEDDKVHLKNILWACKSKVHDTWIYRLVLGAINGEKELAYYAIVKAIDANSLELMEWYSIPRTFLDYDGEKVAERNLDVNAKRNPASKVGSDT